MSYNDNDDNLSSISHIDIWDKKEATKETETANEKGKAKSKMKKE